MATNIKIPFKEASSIPATKIVFQLKFIEVPV
jgi:hypothetical protein